MTFRDSGRIQRRESSLILILVMLFLMSFAGEPSPQVLDLVHDAPHGADACASFLMFLMLMLSVRMVLVVFMMRVFPSWIVQTQPQLSNSSRSYLRPLISTLSYFKSSDLCAFLPRANKSCRKMGQSKGARR